MLLEEEEGRQTVSVSLCPVERLKLNLLDSSRNDPRPQDPHGLHVCLRVHFTLYFEPLSVCLSVVCLLSACCLSACLSVVCLLSACLPVPVSQMLLSCCLVSSTRHLLTSSARRPFLTLVCDYFEVNSRVWGRSVNVLGDTSCRIVVRNLGAGSMLRLQEMPVN